MRSIIISNTFHIVRLKGYLRKKTIARHIAARLLCVQNKFFNLKNNNVSFSGYVDFLDLDYCAI